MKKCLAVFIFVFAAVVLAGCAHSIRYSPSEISGYPPAIRKDIQEQTVAMGMTPNQVRFAWGAPSNIIVLPPAPNGQRREKWTYSELLGTAHTTLIFTGGRVTEMSSKGPTSKKFIVPSTPGK